MSEFPSFDDVGSFPLPNNIDKERFNNFYWTAYKALINKIDIFKNKGIQIYFIDPIFQSFQSKLKAGVEIINYPQHMDMYTQFLKPINDYKIEPCLIDPKKAYIPEVFVIENYAKNHYEKLGVRLKLKICITGPIDLYVRKHQFTVYIDLALNLAKSINSVLKNSIINNKYIETSAISVDEPSFGYIDIFNVTNDDLIKIFDNTLEGINKQKCATQFHIHTLNRAYIPLQTKNFDVITCEYASDKSNKIPKKELEQFDKFIRVGIARTNIDSIIAENIDKGATWEKINTFEGRMDLIDSKERIRKNLLDALKLYRDRLMFIGPDCGLGGWQHPEVAYNLLYRTSKVIQEVKNSKKFMV